MCAFLELPMSTLVKMNPENTHMVHTQMSSALVRSETPCVSPHLVQACHHPSSHTHCLTPCHSLPERHQWALQLRGGWICFSSLIQHILPYCWAWAQVTTSLLPFPFPEENATAQHGKNKQQDLLVILSCCQHPVALYTLADLAWCLNWSQHTSLSSPNYQTESTALK